MKLLALPALLASLSASMLQPTGAQQPAKSQMPAGHPGVINADPTLNWPKAKPEDVSSIDGLLKAFYSVAGGEPGQARDWDRYRSLFTPDARLIPARGNPNGGAMAMYVTITDYIALNKTYFEKGGFMDKEVARRVEQFGNIAQVWSTFESRHSAKDPTPYVRGINSIQLLKDGDRWWIVNVFWDFEGENAKLPAEYLASPAASPSASPAAAATTAPAAAPASSK
ncbi:MAG: nuclear transport factor 2 family protein [Planctomycetota bacterium]|nr:nuclear transport factor 2 family protein [Planctomycetota bacterium]